MKNTFYFTLKALLKKNIYLVIFINLPNFIVWLHLIQQVLRNMCIIIVCYPRCDVMNFKINLIFLNKQFFLHDQKFKTKISIFWEQEELLRWNKKHFSLILKNYHWSKYKIFFGRWESNFKAQIEEKFLSTDNELDYF